MADDQRESLRATFTEDPALYDRVRPSYPEAMFDDLAGVAGLGTGSLVLEIGPGTGQATVPMARRGWEVVAVERARRNLRVFPLVKVVTSAFEDWPLPARPFDAVVSATAFHWIDPDVRIAKSAQALRPDGVLATVATHHVLGGSVDFFHEVQACYERFDPATPPGLRLSPAAEIPYDREEVETSEGLDPPAFFRYEWELAYSTEHYIDLLRTYSGHRALGSAARTGLLNCVAALADARYGGRVVKRYLTELRVSRRR
ncbi:SAM-dependent methyltransferase [Spongiactinospora gelatinilytica]|uniref:SAM-dependent methyltransferase n=1 Tax=Spongiactinospora gelatinilytica TaxID=2666298 RepID=A0A2W2G530_9ACTN|nr:class I SAM-dependent methyltransferase [Spongiactinospora gelatinilytica]PZG44986.1 SAM-dependent methyltransferase [Spongiactinospora gelatinilytica]